MIRIIACCAALFIFLSDQECKAQDVSLPLGPFRDFLMSRYPSCFVNTNGNGELMLNTSCTAITTEDSLEFHNLFDMTGTYTVDLTGLQYFTSLIYLNCNNNQITTYVFPPNLKYLDCSYSMANQPFGSLPYLPGSLETLICTNNAASSIPFTANLKYINVSNNYLSSLAALPSGLKTLICSNQGEPTAGRLTSLPVLNASLEYLDCSNNQLSSLPALPATLLTLICSGNKAYSNPEDYSPTLAVLPALPANLQYLNCSSSKINTLPSLPSTLTYLNCANQRIFMGDINVSPSQPNLIFNEGISLLPSLPTGLTYLNVSKNKLTSLPASLPSGLIYLNCADNVYEYGSNNVQFGIQCLPHLPATLTTLITNNTKINCRPNSGAYSSTLPLCNPTNNANLCVSSPVVSGHVFYDNNSNGTLDPGENFRANVQVNLSNGLQTFTNRQGYYESSADLGSITATIGNPPFYTAVPGSVSHTFSRYDTIVHDLIALQPSVIFDSLRINIIPSFAMRPGFDFVYIVRYENVGTTVISPQISLPFNGTVLSFQSATNPSVSQSGNSLLLTEPSLTPGTVKQFTAGFQVSPTAVLGDTVRASVSATYGTLQSTDSTYSVVRGSFDPNDKQSTPSLTQQEVSEGKFITYLVRFQNTGTDTAFNIVVTDLLDNQLDASSFEMLSASHNSKTTRNGNSLTFEFLNILLPDMTTNEPASHGYILFRIKPLSTVPANSVIQNKANIYFDFNAPIITNVANTEIQLNPVPLSLLSFKGAIDRHRGKALLTWETANEINSSRFVVEISSDGRRFADAGTVPASGMGNHIYRYDTYMEKSVQYFRLRMIDRDGRFTLSPTIRLTVDGKTEPFVLLANPVIHLSLQFRLLDEELPGSVATVFDAAGASVLKFSMKQGLNTVQVSNLVPGIYFLQAGQAVKRFVIAGNR